MIGAVRTSREQSGSRQVEGQGIGSGIPGRREGRSSRLSDRSDAGPCRADSTDEHCLDVHCRMIDRVEPWGESLKGERHVTLPRFAENPIPHGKRQNFLRQSASVQPAAPAADLNR